MCERGRERGCVRGRARVCVCVWEGERERATVPFAAHTSSPGAGTEGVMSRMGFVPEW